jgi:putative heme-binding domain-containing protein
VLDALLAREASTLKLLEALERGSPAPGDFDAARRQRLLTHRNSAIRDRAGQLLETGPLTARQSIVDQYQPVLTMTGDATRGQAVFEKRCAACHALKGIGRVVGADLNAVKDRSTPALLTAILDPNRAVEARYLAYTAVLTDGRTFSGLLMSESGGGIVIAGADGKPNALARSEIDELLASSKSFMPEGLEKDIPLTDMADLIAFIQSTGPAPKTLEGNRPEPVQPEPDGSLKLMASKAEIRGATLVFEKPFQNLGWWQSADDTATWTVQVPRAGRYSVLLHWACAGSAGGRYVIEAADQKLTGIVPSTQTWENFQTAKIGELTLPAGPLRLTMRPAEGGLKGPLLDLKELRLIP